LRKDKERDMFARSLRAAALAAAVLLVGVGTATAAVTVPAIDAYYAFRTVPSANTTRLLADKATAIGLPGQDAISFVAFDRASLPAAIPDGEKALLRLQHDTSLAGNLRLPSAERPLNLGAYGLFAPFNSDRDGRGNAFTVAFGPQGSSVIDVATITENGIYSWDVTETVKGWLADPDAITALAISGIYGNRDLDPFNAYGAFHTVGSSLGMAPNLHVTPLPAAAWMLLAALGGLYGLRRRWSDPHA
jgi:hypothetical protein